MCLAALDDSAGVGKVARSAKGTLVTSQCNPSPEKGLKVLKIARPFFTMSEIRKTSCQLRLNDAFCGARVPDYVQNAISSQLK